MRMMDLPRNLRQGRYANDALRLRQTRTRFAILHRSSQEHDSEVA
jgi:hypothetical protein